MAIFRRRVNAVAVKIETVSGTDSVPVLGTDAIRTVGVPVISVSTVETGDRGDVQHGGMGKIGRAKPAGRKITMDLTVELFGKGTAYAGVPASAAEFQHDPLLRGGGFIRSFGSGIINWTTADTNLETFSMYVYAVDGLLYKCTGCVAKPKLSLMANRPGTITYSIEGKLKEAPAADSIGGLVLPTVIPPEWSGDTLSIGAFTMGNGLVPRKVEIDLGTVTAERPWAGTDGLLAYAVVDRAARMTIEMEPVAPATYDVLAKAILEDDASNFDEVTLGIGTGVGNTFFLHCGRWAIEHPSDVDFGGLAGWSVSGDLIARSRAAGAGAGREFGIQQS